MEENNFRISEQYLNEHQSVFKLYNNDNVVLSTHINPYLTLNGYYTITVNFKTIHFSLCVETGNFYLIGIPENENHDTLRLFNINDFLNDPNGNLLDFSTEIFLASNYSEFLDVIKYGIWIIPRISFKMKTACITIVNIHDLIGSEDILNNYINHSLSL